MSEVKLINVGTLKHYNDKLQEQLANFALSQDCATKEELNNLDFYELQNNPVVNTEDGKLLFADPSGYVGLQLEENGLYVKDVIADGHTLSQKANKSELPTKTSDLTNDSGFITINDVPEVTVPTKTSELTNDSGFITINNVPSLDGYAKTEDIPSVDGFVMSEDLPNFDEFAKTKDIPSLNGYAKTEDIPSLDGYATEQWVNNKNYATEEDLSSIEFNSLQNNPLVEDSNGEFNLVDDLGNVGFRVNQEGLFVKDVAAGDHILSNKQDILVSGTNIKTFNGESILGSGDITISGGSSSGAYTEVNHGTSDTTFTLTPNTFHVWDEVSALALTLGSESIGVANEFLFQFTSGATAATLSLPSDLKWAEELVIEPNRIYQVSILRGLASVLSWDSKSLISFEVESTPNNLLYNAEEGMTWAQFIESDYNISTNGLGSNDFSESFGEVSFMTGSGVSGKIQFNGNNVSIDDLIVNEQTYTIYIDMGGFA